MSAPTIISFMFSSMRDGVFIGACLAACVCMGRVCLVYMPRITAALEKLANK